MKEFKYFVREMKKVYWNRREVRLHGKMEVVKDLKGDKYFYSYRYQLYRFLWNRAVNKEKILKKEIAKELEVA